MKDTKLAFVLLLVLLMIPVLGVVAQDSAPVKWPDLGGREVTVAVENLYCPYNMIKDGEAVGWDYDTFNAICELLNCTPIFKNALGRHAHCYCSRAV
ncbi:MAG: hypothetical protein R3E39_03235 [Anaerolineae bacterium]